jgi:hypothetical protein
LTKIEALGERLDKITHTGNWDSNLTTAEANSVRELWIQLHWTDEEAREYVRSKERMDVLYATAGSCYLGGEESREYSRLSARCTELVHDFRGKRVGANHAMRDRVWPEFAPRALRYWKLREKPLEELTTAEAEELKALQEWFDKLQAEALEASRQALRAAELENVRRVVAT